MTDLRLGDYFLSLSDKMASVEQQYFISALNYAVKSGLDKQQILIALALVSESSGDADKPNRVPLARYNELLQYAASELAEPLFGFHLGQDIRSADYGILGYLIESGDNLTTAIDVLLKYDRLVADIGTCEFALNQAFAEIIWQANPMCNEQVVLRNMTAWVATVRQFFDKNLSPDKVLFQQKLTLAQESQLATWFACAVKGNQQVNAIQFSPNLLTQSFKTENSAIHKLLKQESQQKLAELNEEGTLSENVAILLKGVVNLRDIDLKSAANHFHLSPRTFQRKLLTEQTYFSTLLDVERQQRAIKNLGKISSGDLARELGFKEQSSFNRAFHRWYGCAPKEYLIKNQVDKDKN